MPSPQTTVYDDVIHDLHMARNQLIITGKVIELVHRLAESAVGVLKNAHATSDNNIREYARISYQEILSQIDQLIEDFAFQGINLLDGKSASDTGENFDLHVDMQGLMPDNFNVGAVNLNIFSGHERDGAEPNRLVNFIPRQNASEYNKGPLGDHAIKTDIEFLQSYMSAISNIAVQFAIKNTEREHLKVELEKRREEHIREEYRAEGIFMGTIEADILTGGDADETFHGNGGDDIIDGGAGADLILTGSGSDHINGGAGSDTIYAGDGSDIIDGGDGDDIIYYDADDLETNITGGNGYDRLEVFSKSGVAPTHFNLTAQGFEYAIVNQYDQANDQVEEEWEKHTFFYNDQWEVLSVVTTFDDGSVLSGAFNPIASSAGTYYHLPACIGESDGLSESNSLDKRVGEFIAVELSETESTDLFSFEFFTRDSGTSGDTL
jgi:hypothetical protein